MSSVRDQKLCKNKIDIETVTGKNLGPYLAAVAQLRIKVFREFPYLYEGDTEYEKVYLQKYLTSPTAVAVLARDGDKIVGVSTGLPLEEESDEIQQPFLEKGYRPSDFFYFSESVLLSDYRGQGLGVTFFEKREEHVRKLQRFHYLCFCSVMRPHDHPLRPAHWQPLDEFWIKRGYRPFSDLQCQMQWKDLGEKEESKKSLRFWMKEIK